MILILLSCFPLICLVVSRFPMIFSQGMDENEQLLELDEEQEGSQLTSYEKKKLKKKKLEEEHKRTLFPVLSSFLQEHDFPSVQQSSIIEDILKKVYAIKGYYIFQRGFRTADEALVVKCMVAYNLASQISNKKSEAAKFIQSLSLLNNLLPGASADFSLGIRWISPTAPRTSEITEHFTFLRNKLASKNSQIMVYSNGFKISRSSDITVSFELIQRKIEDHANGNHIISTINNSNLSNCWASCLVAVICCPFCICCLCINLSKKSIDGDVQKFLVFFNKLSDKTFRAGKVDLSSFEINLKQKLHLVPSFFAIDETILKHRLMKRLKEFVNPGIGLEGSIADPEEPFDDCLFDPFRSFTRHQTNDTGTSHHVKVVQTVNASAVNEMDNERESLGQPLEESSEIYVQTAKDASPSHQRSSGQLLKEISETSVHTAKDASPTQQQSSGQLLKEISETSVHTAKDASPTHQQSSRQPLKEISEIGVHTAKAASPTNQQSSGQHLKENSERSVHTSKAASPAQQQSSGQHLKENSERSVHTSKDLTSTSRCKKNRCSSILSSVSSTISEQSRTSSRIRHQTKRLTIEPVPKKIRAANEHEVAYSLCSGCYLDENDENAPYKELKNSFKSCLLRVAPNVEDEHPGIVFLVMYNCLIAAHMLSVEDPGLATPVKKIKNIQVVSFENLPKRNSLCIYLFDKNATVFKLYGFTKSNDSCIHVIFQFSNAKLGFFIRPLNAMLFNVNSNVELAVKFFHQSNPDMHVDPLIEKIK